jgi:hypothetical protein
MLSLRQRIFPAVTHAVVLPTGRPRKIKKFRAKAACFPSLRKAPRANSFVLDTPRWFVSDEDYPPIEGRIPDAI